MQEFHSVSPDMSSFEEIDVGVQQFREIFADLA